jgi:hypothetical protein
MSPGRCPVPKGPLCVASCGLGNLVPVGVGEFADDPARDTSNQHACRKIRVRKHHRPCSYQSARADPRTAKNHGPDADERASLNMRAMDNGTMAEAHAIFEHCGLTCINMETAQILDIALGADHDVIVVRP